MIERSDWTVESWSVQGTSEECLADYPGWHPDIHTLIKAIDRPHKWALLGREPMPRWSVGRATLLGDACHPTLPFLAQGAGMAIEDGFILGQEGQGGMAGVAEQGGAAPRPMLHRLAADEGPFVGLVDLSDDGVDVLVPAGEIGGAFLPATGQGPALLDPGLALDGGHEVQQLAPADRIVHHVPPGADPVGPDRPHQMLRQPRGRHQPAPGDEAGERGRSVADAS